MTYCVLLGLRHSASESLDHLHNGFEHITTLKVDYLGVSYRPGTD